MELGGRKVDRRTVLRGGVAGVSGLAVARLTACAPPMPTPTDDPEGFDCGVASGIHAPDASVIWTRFAPAAVAAVTLEWEVATDPSFGQVVAGGEVLAEPDSDGCAKVLVAGLRPGTRYWYRFSADGRHGPVGRTRTPGTGEVPSARFAVASCQQFTAGYFPAWRVIAESDIDAVIFLGDYIYESGGGSWPLSVRQDTVGEAKDLASYRAKYRLYRSDADLRAAHAAHAFIPVWDDHEFVDDCHRDLIAQESQRSSAAYRAWWEYQPVWRTDGNRIHRSLRWGRLVDLAMLDSRQYRDPPVTDQWGNSILFGDTSSPPLSQVHHTDRTLLGAAQRDWLLDGLGASQDDGVRWKLIGNQVMLSPIRPLDLDVPVLRDIDASLPRNAGIYVNFDDWNGYFAERDRLTSHIADEAVSGVAFLTGDIHHFFQSPVRLGIDGPPVAQEFVCGSIASRGVDHLQPLAAELSQVLRSMNPAFRYADLEHRGFGMVECTPERMAVDYVTVDALDAHTTAAARRHRRRARFEWSGGPTAPTLQR